MRALLIAAATALAAFGLSACSLPPVGAVAVGVDDAGGPVLVMASCEGPAEHIEVSSAPETGTASPTVQDWREDLELSNPEPRDDDPAAVSLTDPGGRWEAVIAGAEFTEGRVYEARAWPTTEGTLGSIDFTTAEIADLGEGEVLYYDEAVKRRGPVADFVDAGLAHC
ncbi:hypothetical protein [Glycomyces paridis]|uniref:Lipoprotein n=1 Tax=Glycomyces paridis TaxID=2126555 RepID=A0A4S8PD72_9ACTN|nr:hypothetical protein [Glycomyces paridis]THV28318.1 hypothetical protein E9998_11940 [Glycomyces paridis]